MKNKHVLTAIFLVAASFSLSVGISAQTSNDQAYDQYIKLLRKDLKSDKKQFVAMNISLTDAEATKFWPVYDQYSNELSKIYDRRLALIKEYAAKYESLTDATAADLNRRSVEVDQAITNLRQKYLPLIAKVLPGKKAARFFQIDKRIGLLIDLQLASEIPIVDQ